MTLNGLSRIEGPTSARSLMTRLLETGLDLLAAENPHGLPAVKGWNIINGQLTEASDGARFESRNPANKDDLLGNFPRSTKDDVHAALDAAHAALTRTPATMMGQEAAVGALRQGCSADLVVFKGALLDLSARHVATWIDGVRVCGSEPEQPRDLAEDRR